jgi:hypothetical protein
MPLWTAMPVADSRCIRPVARCSSGFDRPITDHAVKVAAGFGPDSPKPSGRLSTCTIHDNLSSVESRAMPLFRQRRQMLNPMITSHELSPKVGINHGPSANTRRDPETFLRRWAALRITKRDLC